MAETNLDVVFTLSISVICQLYVKMAQQIDSENFMIFELLRSHDLELGLGHMAYHCASLIDFYLNA